MKHFKILILVALCFVFSGLSFASSEKFVVTLTTTPVTIYSGVGIIEDVYAWNYSTFTVTIAVTDASNNYHFIKSLTTLTEGSISGSQITATGYRIGVSSVITTNNCTQDLGFTINDKNKVGAVIHYQK